MVNGLERLMSKSLEFGLVTSSLDSTNKKYWYSKNGGSRQYVDNIFSVFRNYIPKLIAIDPKGFDGVSLIKLVNVFIFTGYEVDKARQKRINLSEYTDTHEPCISAFSICLINEVVGRNKIAAKKRKALILNMAKDLKDISIQIPTITKAKKMRTELISEIKKRWNYEDKPFNWEILDRRWGS